MILIVENNNESFLASQPTGQDSIVRDGPLTYRHSVAILLSHYYSL